MLDKIPAFIKNKYVLTFLGLLVWLLFFDRNDIITQVRLSQKLHQLKDEKAYYQKEIAKNKEDLKELKTNPANLEKFAREKYLMKKDNEDIFVIEHQGKKKDD